MLRLLRIVLPGLLFALVAVQYAQFQRLKAENEKLKVELRATQGTDGGPYGQSARTGAPVGGTKARGSRTEQKSSTPRNSAANSKKDLERFLDIARPQDRAQASARRLYRISNCRELEIDSNKYAGQRISITDIVEKMDNFYDFSRCSGIRISFDRLDDAGLAALKSKFGPKHSASLTMRGDYSGIELAVDKIR